MESLIITNPDGSTETLYTPHPNQCLFHERTEANVLYYGGRGSGKSLALRMEAHARALANPGFVYAILRRKFPELERSHIMFLPAEMKKLGGYYNKSSHKAFYPNGSIGVYSQCADAEDVLNLLSFECVWIGFDELSTFEWDMFTKLATSVRVKRDSGLTAMVRGATNPLGPSAQEVMHYFVDRDVDPEEDMDYDPSDWYAIKGNAVDNPHLDLEQYKKRFAAGLASHVKKAWVDGDFALENSLFDFYPTKEVKDENDLKSVIPYHVIKTLPYVGDRPILSYEPN